LMNSLGCPILYLENGGSTLYESYDALLHRREAPAVRAEAAPAAAETKPGYGKEQRRRRAELRQRIKALEEELETLGADIVALEGDVNDPEILRDHVRLREVCDALDDKRFHQEEVFAEWERLVDEQNAQSDEEQAQEEADD
ncbi:MAG: ABC transporter C-terminal domain-containing protein, partial [Ruthenibacterium sp.]